MISLCSRVKFEFKPIAPSPCGPERKTRVKQCMFKVHFPAQQAYS